MQNQPEVLVMKREVEMKTALLDLAVANNNLDEAYEIEKEINDINRNIEQIQPEKSIKAEDTEVQEVIEFTQAVNELPSIEKQLEYMRPLSQIEGNDNAMFKAIYDSLEALSFIDNDRVVGDGLTNLLKDVQRPYSIMRQRQFLKKILNVLMTDQEDLIKMMYGIDETLCMGEFIAQATADRLLEQYPSNRPEVWNEKVAPIGTLVTLTIGEELVDGKIIYYTHGRPSVETYDGRQYFAVDTQLLERRKEVVNG